MLASRLRVVFVPHRDRLRSAEIGDQPLERLVAQFESEQFCTELGDASVAGCQLRCNGPRPYAPPAPHRAVLFRGAWMSDQSREASTLQNTVAFLSIALAVVLLFYASHGT